MYINTQTLTQHTESEIRALYPNTSFPHPFVAPEGYAYVFPAPQPAHNPVTQSVRGAAPELTGLGNWEQRWEVVALDPDAVAANQAAQAAQARAAAKVARAQAVEAIQVTTQAGNTFDGDELSQGRMSRAIIALSTGLAPSVNWVLADNSVIAATAAELTEALVLAGMAQAAIWVIE